MSESESGPDSCPVCGQGFDHKREERTSGGGATLRADATSCKTPGLAGTRVVYVHLNTQPVTRVTRVQSSPDEDEPSGGTGLFSFESPALRRLFS